MNIKDFRNQNPEAKDYSDDEIVRAVKQEHYPDYSETEVADAMGVYSSSFIDYEKPTKETIPTPYVDDYKNHSIEASKINQNKYRFDRMNALQKHFREADPVYTNWFKRTGQSVIRGLNRMFDGLETFERKTGIVPQDYYEKRRKMNIPDFGERYVRKKQYENTSDFDEVVQTVAEFSPMILPMFLTSMALGPAVPAFMGITGTLAGTTPIAAGTAAEVAMAAFVSIAAETGSRRNELDSDGRYSDFSSSEKDSMAIQYGIASGAVEAVGTVIGFKILKATGSGLIKAITKTGASSNVVKKTSSLMGNIKSFSNSKPGQYLKLALAPVLGGSIELAEEELQTYIGEALHVYHLNPEQPVKDTTTQFFKRLDDPEFKKQMAHTRKIAFGAGLLIPGVINTVTMAARAKADIFNKASDNSDIDRQITDVITKIDKDIEELKKDPGANPDKVAELMKYRETFKKVQEVEEAGEIVDAESIEEETNKEQERYKKLLEAQEETQEPKTTPTIQKDRRVYPVDPGGAGFTGKYRRSKERRQFDTDEGKKDRRSDIETAREISSDKDKLKKKVPLHDSKGNVQPSVEPTVKLTAKADNRPGRLSRTGLSNPTGQTKTPKTKGLIFAREGKYKNTKGESLPKNVDTLPEKDYWSSYNRAILDTLENKIASGKWKFQELFDNVVAGTPNISIKITDEARMKDKRGNLQSRFDMNGNIVQQRIAINPETIDLMHGEQVSGTEVVLVHELLHALHGQRVGISSGARGKTYFKAIHDLWTSIPKESISRFEYFASEFYNSINVTDPTLLKIWNSYTDEQRSTREAWYTLLNTVTGLNETDIKWDEVMSYAMSDPNLMSDLYNIPASTVKGKPAESIGSRMLRTFLEFIQDILGKGKISLSLMDDILDIHSRYTNNTEFNRQSYNDIDVTEEHRNSLYIKGNKNFPKGSKFLNPAIKIGDKIYQSTIGHWDIITEFDLSLDYEYRDGFVAVNRSGSPLKFYSRIDAGNLVDPKGKITGGKNLLSEDLPEINISQDSKIIKSNSEQVKRRRRLSAADIALLEARKKDRGGKTLSETWAAKRKQGQKEMAAAKYHQKIKQDVPSDRWTTKKATDGLNSKNDNALDREYSHVLKELKTIVDKGASKKTPRFIYYKLRKEAIELFQEKRHMDKVKVQRARQNELSKKAGATTKANVRFYKAEYKRLVRMDAPHSAVQFVRGQLLDLMGDKFFSWSGEKTPVIKHRKEKEIIKKEITSKGSAKVKKIASFTEEDAKKRDAKEGDEEGAAVAKTPQEARDKFDSVMGHIRDNYISKGKKLPVEYITKISETVLKQAKVYEVIDSAEMEQAISELASAMEGMTESFDSKGPGKVDSIQLKMDEMMPVKVRFDAFHAPSEGYVPSGFMFTITDSFHPANKSTFAVPELTQKAINKKFKEIDKFYNSFIDSSDMKWHPVSNNSKNTTEISEIDEETGDKLEINLVHYRAASDEVFTNTGETFKIPFGTPKTDIDWAILDKNNNNIYDREFTKDNKLKKSNLKLGYGVIKRIQTLLGKLDRNELVGSRPAYIHFTSQEGDTAKGAVYKKFAKRIAKYKDWVVVFDSTGIHIFDSNYKPTQIDINRTKTILANLGINKDTGPSLTPEEALSSARNQVSKVLGNLKKTIHKTLVFTNDIVYSHTDGGQYYNLSVDYNKNSKHLIISGEHVHYGETTVLFDGVINKPILSNISKQLLNKLEIEESPEPDIEPMPSSLEAIYESLDTKKHVMSDPKMEKDAALGEKGKVKTPWYISGIEWITNFKNISREFEHLKRKEFGDVQFILRQLKHGKEIAAQKAVDNLKNILDDLDKNQYHNLQRLAYLMDMREQVIINQDKVAKGEDPEELVVNPWGWNDKQILKEAENIWKIVRRDQPTYEAWRTRQDAWYRLRVAYKDSMDRVGFDVSRKLNRVYYFRHQILDMMKMQHRYFGLSGSNKLAVPSRRSFLKARGAKQEHAINLNYVQAEFEVMAQMTYDTQISNTLADIMDQYGKEEDPGDGYTLYRPREESIFYMVNTIPGWIANNIMIKGSAKVKLKDSQIKKALAFGGKYEGYYLPTELAKTLETALAKRPYGDTMRGLRSLQTAWKMWNLLNPLRALKYTTRNMTGDAEAVYIGNAKVFAQVPGAVKDLWVWQRTSKATKVLQDWFDRGGPQSAFSAQEITKVVELPEFRKQLGKSFVTVNPVKWGKSWFKLAKWGNNLREIMLRYAAYKHFDAEIRNNNGKPKRYAASLPEEVDVITGIRDKAFLMSNDLLGAYDRISVGGENLRQFWIPFWSFQEINAKRTVAMFRNAANDDKAVSTIGKYLGARTSVAALKLGMLGLKFMAFSALVQAWNEWMHGDAEDILPDEMRERSHIILSSPKSGDPKDTEIVYFPRVGIVGDLLEWTGFESLPSDARDIYQIISGEKTWEQKSLEMEKVFDKYEGGKENARRVLNKVVQSFGPLVKIPTEFLMKEKLFPSVTNRQPITDTGRWLVEQTGFQAIYDAVMKRPQPKEPFKKLAKSAAIYSGDKTRLGWLAIQQKKSEYQRKHGLKGRGFIVTETGSALYNLGLAWRYGDEKALSKYTTEYLILATNKLTKKINLRATTQRQWEKLNPLDGLSDIHKKLFITSLDKRGWKQWNLAMTYYAEMRGGVQFLRGETAND